MAKIINFFGAPSSGKTTSASLLFSFLKEKGLNVGLLNEFATFKILEENKSAYTRQYYLTSKQLYNQEILESNYDIVVTDSPIILCEIYNEVNNINKYFNTFILEKFKSKDNLNILLKTNIKNYSAIGRIHTAYQLSSIHSNIKSMLEFNKLNYLEISDIKLIYNEILEQLI